VEGIRGEERRGKGRGSERKGREGERGREGKGSYLIPVLLFPHFEP